MQTSPNSGLVPEVPKEYPSVLYKQMVMSVTTGMHIPRGSAYTQQPLTIMSSEAVAIAESRE
jgi:hypothetical protein